MGSSLNVRVGVLYAQLPLNAAHSISVGYLIESIKARSTIMTLKTSQYNHLQGCILNHTSVGEVLLRNPLYQQVIWLSSLTNEQKNKSQKSLNSPKETKCVSDSVSKGTVFFKIQLHNRKCQILKPCHLKIDTVQKLHIKAARDSNSVGSLYNINYVSQ